MFSFIHVIKKEIATRQKKTPKTKQPPPQKKNKPYNPHSKNPRRLTKFDRPIVEP